MIYLLFGKQKFLIDKKIKNIISENNIDSLNISKYNLEEDDLKSVIDDASIMSLFADKKLIIVENSFIFSTIKKKKDIDTKILENYLENINPDSIIIFISNDENINNVKKIVKTIKKIGTVIEFNEVVNKNFLVKELFENYKISEENLNIFLNRVGNDIGIIEQEINKLKLYKDQDFNITKEDIMNISSKNYDLNIFNLIDNIINKKIDLALEEYYEMLKYNEEPIKIISILADNFRLMYQTKELYKKGYSSYDMASHLNANPYRIKIILNKGINYTPDKLLKLIDNLAKLDIDIKTGKIDKKLGLELFIIKQKEVN